MKHVQIRFHSKISFEQYKLILQQSDVAVNLSRRSKEFDTEGGCPVFVKDALWFGKPVFLRIIVIYQKSLFMALMGG